MGDQARATIGESALLVVDVQDSFKVAATRWERRSPHSFEANLRRLIEAYRRAHLPVVFILHNDDDPGFQPGSPQVKLMDFLGPRPEEPVMSKTTQNAFMT